MINEKNKQVLETLLGYNVEFLALVHNSTSTLYYWFHVMKLENQDEKSLLGNVSFFFSHYTVKE